MSRNVKGSFRLKGWITHLVMLRKKEYNEGSSTGKFKISIIVQSVLNSSPNLTEVQWCNNYRACDVARACTPWGQSCAHMGQGHHQAGRALWILVLRVSVFVLAEGKMQGRMQQVDKQTTLSTIVLGSVKLLAVSFQSQSLWITMAIPYILEEKLPPPLLRDHPWSAAIHQPRMQ